VSLLPGAVNGTHNSLAPCAPECTDCSRKSDPDPICSIYCRPLVDKLAFTPVRTSNQDASDLQLGQAGSQSELIEWTAQASAPVVAWNDERPRSQIEVNAVDRQPRHPFHPGEMLLEEFLQPQGMSQAEFARKIGWTKARLNELIRGKRGITAEAALDLAEALGTSPKLWMNLQATYDLDRAAAARNAA